MNYLTAAAISPVYEFPYSGFQAPAIPYHNNDIDSLLSSIAPPLGDIYNYQPPSFTLQCVPQITPSVGTNAIVYHVPENMPIETILQQFGISTGTLQPSGSLNNYYRSSSQPIDLTIHSHPNRRRRLVCREVSDSEDDSYYKRPSHHQHHPRHRHSSGPDRRQQSPVAIHNLLDKVWNKARNASEHMPPSSSAPNLNWQAMRNNSPPTPPPNANTNNAWQAMRNSPPPMSQVQRNAVNNVWNRAEHASEQNANRMSNVFNRMQQPTGGIIQRPPPLQNREAVHDFLALRNLPPGINQPSPPQNREAVHDFLAVRNLPPGLNQPPPPQNREAVHDFYAARNLPFGVNQPPPPQNREAVHDFYAARNLPFGVNQPPPPQNREAVHDFYAARNLPFGVNQPPPPQNREAVQNFFAARNIPPGINQPNPAVANVWNRADYAVHHQPPPPINYGWNRTSQGPAPPYSPFGLPSRGPSNTPAPSSFGSLLAQAHRQHLPYAGSA